MEQIIRRKKGEGTVREYKAGKWNARIKLNGKSHDLYGDSEKEVVKKLNELKKKIALGKTDNKRISYSDFLDSWLAKKKLILKEQSYYRLESTIELHIKPLLGFYNLDKIDTATIQDYVINAKAKLFSYSSVKKIYDAINESMREARSMGKIIHNPVDLVVMPVSTNELFSNKKNKEKNKTENLEIFTDTELEKFITAAHATHKNGKPIYKNAGLFILMLNTGLRLGEATAVKWSDYNDEYKTLRIFSSIIQSKNSDGKRIIKEQKSVKTKGSERILKLNSKALSALPEIARGTYIFCNIDGKPLRPRNVQNTLDSILNRAGISHKSTHIFRHTFASRLFAKGIDVKIVSELLGHTDVRITYNTYITLINQQKVQAMEAIEDMY
ncbi:MAG: site-specific integrase [Oscillospiraceae bacterium]|nr:site-specific integrase [Oscillospiraceae bacterium]